MTNVALNKTVLEQNIINAKCLTNGEYDDYSTSDNYAFFDTPNFITIDLENKYHIYCIRFLLWDGLSKNPNPDDRKYLYKLLVSKDNENWIQVYDTEENGTSGWQIFDFPKGEIIRYIRIHGIKNSINNHFHIVEIEVHDDNVISDFDNIGVIYEYPDNHFEYIQKNNPVLKNKEKSINTFNQYYKNYLKLNLEILIKDKEGYSFSFLSVYLNSLSNLLEQINTYRDYLLPNALDDINLKLEKVLKTLDVIMNFNSHIGVNPNDQYFNVSLAFTNNLNDLIVTTYPYVSYFEIPNISNAEIREKVKESNELINKLKSDSEEFNSKVNDLFDSIKELGVSKYAECFKNQSKFHKSESDKWMKWTIGLSIATFVFTFLTLYGEQLLNLKYTDTNYINIAVSKFAIFTLLSTATFWCGNIYKSHWHNYIVNQHRQNAMSTFEIFFNSATNEEIKNAILLQSSQAIFTLQHSGFLKGSQDSGNQTQILEIVRGMTSSVDK